MQIPAELTATIATTTGFDLDTVEAFLPVYVETAARLVQAGETTLENLDHELVARVASERIRRTLEANVDTILERVWEAANAAA